MHQYKGWDGEYFINQSKLIGPMTTLVVDQDT